MYYTILYYIIVYYISSARRAVPGQSHFCKANSITALEETGIRSRMKPKENCQQSDSMINKVSRAVYMPPFPGNMVSTLSRRPGLAARVRSSAGNGPAGEGMAESSTAIRVTLCRLVARYAPAGTPYMPSCPSMRTTCASSGVPTPWPRGWNDPV